MKVPRKLTWTLILLVVVILLGGVATVVDYRRTGDGKAPMYVIRTGFYFDGGTRRYQGFGYTVMVYHRISYRIEEDGELTHVVLTGPAFRHWLLPLRKDMSRTIETPTGEYMPEERWVPDGEGEETGTNDVR